MSTPDDENIVTKFGDANVKVIDLLPAAPEGAIKVFEPAMKDPADQLQYTLDQIEALKAGQAAENYAGAFDPKSDQWFVQTGNANVTQVESLSSIFSTAPEIRDDGPCWPCVFFWISLAYAGYYFYVKGRK